MHSVGRGAVGLWHCIRLAIQDGKLAASAGTKNLLSADGCVVDLRGRLDVVDGALTSLVIAGEAP